MFNMSDLTRIPAIGQLAPEAFAGFKALDKAALAEGAIPKKYKELMAIAVALTTQCPYCIQAPPTVSWRKLCSLQARSEQARP
jgi:alkylhydroperoxidase/carboxymuconolactone decarboxylase family protein YurZ